MITELTLSIGTDAAYMQALKSFNEGGVPVGSALLINDAVISLGHNQRVQKGSNILHGETDCIENAGQQVDFTKSVLFTTLSPCSMCAGSIVLFKIPTLVILDDENTADFPTNEDWLRDHGVDIVIHKHAPSIELNRRFQTDPATRQKWLGDVGV
jgi:cytosine deaminase